MAKQAARYKSIGEVRSSLYPGSAGILHLERGDVLDLRGGVARRRVEVTNGDKEDYPEETEDLEEPDED